MSDSKCEKCHKILSGKQALKRHSERKFPCKAVDVKINEENNVKNTKKSQSKSLRKVCEKVCEKSAKLKKTNFEICCNYCKTIFTHRNSLYKHKSHLRCEKMPKYEMKRRALKLKNKGVENLNENTKNKIKSLNI